MPVLGDGAVRRPDRDPEHQPDRAARSHIHELPHDLQSQRLCRSPSWRRSHESPCLAAPSGTWRARSWLRRPRPSAGGIVAATCGRAGRLVRPGGLGLQLAPDTYLPSKTEYASAPIICVNGSRAKAARAANPSQRANNTASSEGVPPRSGSPNRRCLLTAELAAAWRCRTAGSGAFSRRVWCCAEPARLGVSGRPPPSAGLRGTCSAAAVAAGQSSRRVVRAGRLVRTGPDRPEGPRPSGPDPQPPVRPQVRQEGICSRTRTSPSGSAKTPGDRPAVLREEERLRARRGGPTTGSGESAIPPAPCALPSHRRTGGQVRCGPLLEDECGAKPGYLENLP